jgi:hypothetical protein
MRHGRARPCMLMPICNLLVYYLLGMSNMRSGVSHACYGAYFARWMAGSQHHCMPARCASRQHLCTHCMQHGMHSRTSFITNPESFTVIGHYVLVLAQPHLNSRMSTLLYDAHDSVPFLWLIPVHAHVLNLLSQQCNLCIHYSWITAFILFSFIHSHRPTHPNHACPAGYQ